MKSSKEIIDKLKAGDFIIVGAVVLISLVLFIFSFFSGGKLVAYISLDGESFRVLNLYEITEEEVIKVGGCEILCENDGVTFLSSDCSDKLCVNRGKLKNAGDSMACVPERVAVVLKEAKGNGVDAVVF